MTEWFLCEIASAFGLLAIISARYELSRISILSLSAIVFSPYCEWLALISNPSRQIQHRSHSAPPARVLSVDWYGQSVVYRSSSSRGVHCRKELRWQAYPGIAVDIKFLIALSTSVDRSDGAS